MQRRLFLKNTAALAATSMILPAAALDAPYGIVKKPGVQLFSLPKLLEKDFRRGMAMLSHMGYREIELYGPFPFSAQSAKTSWESITPMLGFSGSGYFGHSAVEIKNILKENRIKATAIHTDLDTLKTGMAQLGEAADIIGFEYIGLPAIPEEKRKTLDDYKRIAETFNSIGEAAKKVGLKFAYHNHGYGLKEENGQTPLNIILDNTDKNLVFFEMDIFWTVAGGANPVDYFESYPNRYRLMHLKDMSKKVHFATDGGSPTEWIALFPYMTTVGSGVLDLKSIITSAKKAGVKHFFVEQDMVSQPEVALKKSIDFLKTL